MSHGTRFGRQALLPALALTTLLALLAGCGAGPRSSDDSTAARPDSAAEGQKAPDPDLGATDTGVAARSIVYTGTMGVRVDDVDGAAAQAVTLVTTAGGFVGADRRSSGAVTDEAVLELRVPAARFTALIDQLAALGDQLHRDVKTEDVTEETVDLAARIETQRVRVASGRKLLAGVTDRTEWLAMEREVAQRESDLAALEAKQRRLADLVALSTITVTFFRAAPPTAEETDPGFTDALTGSLDVLAQSGRILLLVVGALLPWLFVIALPVAALLLIRRRRRRRPGGGGSGPAAGGSAPTPPPAPAPVRAGGATQP
ncbi:DUF4349 domain-containing protein [Melissospora conviva]|uniref:DUF4349 domain-containing protein n=1 Tax=Melissospora conviva TaxID=3388432 RepID=UPI003B820E12